MSKAPDVIYVTPVRTWDTKHIPDLVDNIYIRKDALLEWANALNECGATLLAVDTLIDKLNNF